MGGLGSGCYARDAKDTTEQYPSVNISALRKQGVLDSGGSGFVPWYWWGELTALIASEFRGGLLVLHCFRRYDDEWRRFSRQVGLDQTPCNFGGLRDWFLCPLCAERAGVLYAARTRFACRHCLNLTYQSTRESGLVRLFKKQTQIIKKLGGTGSTIPEKPKNMHWKTYNRLVTEYCQWGRVSCVVFQELNAKFR
jgi:hypothetical protein